MTIKMSTIIALKEVCENLKSQKTSIKTAYRISKILNTIEKEFTFYQTKFAEIINDYAEKDENGQPILVNDGQGVKIDPSRLMEAQTKLTELEGLEVEIESNLTIDELEGLEISISDMQYLSYLLVDA